VTSLRRRLVLGHVVSLVVILAFLEGFADHQMRRELLRQFDAASGAKARALASLVESGPTGPVLRFADEKMPEFERGPAAEYFEIRRGDGSLLERSRSLGERSLPIARDAVDQDRVWALDLPDGRPGRAVVLRFEAELPEPAPGEREPVARSSPAGPLTIVIARSSARLHQDLVELRVRLAAAGIALLAIGVAATSFLVRRALAPVAALGERATAIGPDSLGARFPPGGQVVELEPIRERLNELLDRVEAAFERERRFTADAAHELRTPIAEIHAAAELALAYPADAEVVRHAVDTAVSSSSRMERLVASLLLLARSDAGHLVVECEDVDVPALLRELWRPLDESARARGISVENRGGAGGRIATDRVLLGVVLGNLLGNAAEHTPTGGRVAFGCIEGSEGVEVHVENTVAGLGTEDLPRLFERFWRRDGARTSDRHAGIGLSVASGVTRWLGGAVRAEMRSPSTLAVVLSLPRAPAPPRDPEALPVPEVSSP